MGLALQVRASIERFPVAGSFNISRGSRREAVVVVATVSDGRYAGRGEATPYARYGESVEGVVADIQAAGASLTDRAALQGSMRAGAARNALDCALFDLEAKRSRRRVHELAGLPAPAPLTTVYTISLDEPAAMAGKAAACGMPVLKIKLGGPGDVARLRAVRAARPDSRIVVDANEGWSADDLGMMLAECADAGVELVEQPLPEGKDEALRGIQRSVPVCADESMHTRADLPRLASLYDAVNIKLDKAGGLTEALAVRDAARALGLKVMVGCMLASSLAMAPAFLVAQGADWVDLDAPLLLAADRSPSMPYDGSSVLPAGPDLWG
jgi:L-alanine-DL-glutamate epimerase-like enolase superfamily enzyme